MNTKIMNTQKEIESAINLQTANRLAEAEKVYLRILEDDPDNHDALQLLGLVFRSRGQNSESVALIEKAIKLRPDVAAFHHNIAGVYRQMGRMDDAVRSFREAIALKPDYAESYQGLSEMMKFEADDPMITKIEEQLTNGNLSKDQLSYFSFAAGKIHDDIGEYQKAFAHYTKANHSAGRTFDPSVLEMELKDSLYVFSQEFVEECKGSGSTSDKPVFVVGMPRSGSTLVEQILASHSKVFGAGELNDIKSIARGAADLVSGTARYPDYLPFLSAKHFKSIADAYLERIDSFSGGSYERVVDKHPLNFKFIGLILAMFPNAKIIHTRRNALDTCLSCYFQNFSRGQDYSFDLTNLASFYRHYRRFMSHWGSVFGDRVYHVDYEKLLSNQEEETRLLLSYCQLEFEEGCLKFHESKRDVKTASFLQVRKPIYQSSVGRWKNYELNLKGLAVKL
ncbi:MAG: tetratricopeptide (TPR) repeat protein [Candidatus Azotimanducaceae bacterium]|jgi:tetratricopeptide (TPR) repeat protein